MRFLADADSNTEGEVIITGTGSTDPGTGLPVPTGPVLSKRFATVTWDYVEPQPQGSLQGFEVVLFTGEDPAATANYVVAPQMVKPGDRSLQVLLEMRSQQSIKAAVRALYPDGYASAWAEAPAAAVFIPTSQAYGTSGSLKMPDGTLIQWVRTAAITGQQEVTVTWPVPFPHACWTVQPATENMDGDRANDAMFQLRRYDSSGCVIFRQSPNSESDGKTNRAHILAIGY